MPGFMPGIHVYLRDEIKTWMAGTSPHPDPLPAGGEREV